MSIIVPNEWGSTARNSIKGLGSQVFPNQIGIEMIKLI
jgi:hypothetical protein